MAIKKRNKAKIGILTDTETVNLVLESAIDKSKFQIIKLHSDISDLYHKIYESNLSCLFLKTGLKNIDGLELCAQLREHKELKDMKIIFLSSNPSIAESAIQYRADHFLKLPIKQLDIVHALDKLLQVKKVVLYVEDSSIFHQSVVPELQAEGYQVIEAWDGAEGLSLLHQSDVDIIISDVEMPNMDGFTLCSHVKSNSFTKDIPVIMTTTLDSEESIKKGFDAGANDYLIKPFVIPELLNRIAQHLKLKLPKRPERILIVDDDPISRNIIVRALKYNEFEPESVRNGRIALSKLRNKNYELVITAYRMSFLDGHQLTLTIREDPNLSHLPIIMVNSRDKLADLVKLKSLGIQAFIAKPFNSDRLIAEVERVLAQDRLNRERTALRHYLTDEAIYALSKSVENQEAKTVVEDCYRTILFTDIVKFTPMCEKLTSHEVVNLLNIYFDKMVEILYQYDASIDKFIGDAIMALFGRVEDGAHRAVCAGMDMVASLESVRKETGIDIHMRVGVNSGHVILGDIGSRLYRRDFTVIGDNVNTAQRLESNAGTDGVLISKSTYDLLEGLVDAEPKELTLKGKKAPFLGYQVKNVQPYDKNS